MALAEFNAWKKKVRSWLVNMAGMSGDIAGRVYWGWPMSRAMPMITLLARRVPADDYGFHAWGGTLYIDVHGTDISELDSIEDRIENWLQDADNSILASLTTTDVVLCGHFQMAEEGVGPDEYSEDEQDTGFAFMTRRLPFGFLIVSAQANQP